MSPKKGEVSEAKLVKAGCGIRYDPDELGDQTGFNFESAPDLISDLESEEENLDETTKRKPETKQKS